MNTVTAEIFGQRQQARPRPGTSASWPAPLGPAAYTGVLGEIVQAQAPETEADPAGVLLTLFVMLGNAIGRSVHFRVGADRHHLHLFLGIVGRTSGGRKGVGLSVGKAIMAGIDASWMHRWTTGLSTGEGLIYAVRDPVETQKPVKEKGRHTGEYETVIDDHGVEDKRLFIVETELASVLRRMGRDGNTLSAVLRQAWDGSRLASMTKGSPYTATDPHVSIVAHITRPELRRLLETTEADNGLANRFLWCAVERQQLLPDGGAEINWQPYQTRLAEVLEWARVYGGGELMRDEAASALWHRAYPRLTAERPGLLGKVTSRAEAQVMRLACLYAVSERSDVVTVPHLRAAFEVWRYCRESAAYIFGSGLGDKDADTLLAALKEVYPASLTKTQIGNQVYGKNKGIDAIDHAIRLLVEAGLVDVETDRSATGPGRPPQRIVFTGDGRNGNDGTIP